jgi:Protein of unknown function with HXXEE motif
MNTQDAQSPAIRILSWLFPLTYLIHIAEEYWGGEGYPAYLFRLRGVHLTPTRFLIDQAIGFGLVLFGVLFAKRLKLPRFMPAMFGALVLTNAVTHTATALLYWGYGPGLLSSLLLWVPLGTITLWRVNREMPNRKFFIAVATGIAINGIVALVTLRGGRFV